MRAGYTVTFCALLLVPLATAIPMGTFANPELTDGQGDVDYGDHYVGPRPIESIDFLRGWIEYRPANDEIAFHTHFVDLTDWQRATEDSLECRLLGGLEVEGTPVGRLTLEWTRRENQDQITSGAYHDKDTATRRPLDSTWSAQFERPGNFTIFVPRNALASIATHVAALELACDHIQYVPTTDIGFGNTDVASSEEAFSIQDLAPSAGEAPPEPGVDDTPTSSSAETSDATDTLGFMAALAVIGVATFVRRRKSTR